MDSSKKDFKFDKRAASYDDGCEGKISQRFYNALLAQVKLQQSSNVLDVGCGTGYLLKKMAERQDINGYGIDVEENMIKEAKSKCPDMNIQIAPCEDTPFDDDTFDLVTACMAYHHFSDKEGFAKEASRLLKTGGHLYIADPRFPFVIRKIINGLSRLLKVTGKFFTPQEIADRFKEYGFEVISVDGKGYVQVVELRKV